MREQRLEAFEAGLRPSLLARAKRDERARRRFGRACGTNPADEAYRAVLVVDDDNREWFNSVLRTLGRWPWRTRVGEEGAEAAWLIAQHGVDDPEFRDHCLALLGDAVSLGEADPRCWALLFDRVCVVNGRPQRFGTQWIDLPDDRRLWPLEHTGSVDSARAGVGLPPIEGSFEEMEGLALFPPG